MHSTINKKLEWELSTSLLWHNRRYEQVTTRENIKEANMLFIQDREDYGDEGDPGTPTDLGCNPESDVCQPTDREQGT